MTTAVPDHTRRCPSAVRCITTSFPPPPVASCRCFTTRFHSDYDENAAAMEYAVETRGIECGQTRDDESE